jgi:energy-converting hydrogenase A subunit R
MGRKFFVSDCEGPISINDNAFELSGHFIDDGEKFFEIISKYDDVLADVLKRPGYNAGGTLKLIVPFLKAFDADNENIINFSIENVHLIKGAVETLNYIKNTMPSFIVSTSYNHYIQALCNVTGFPFKNTYSTKLDLDYVEITESEKKTLKEYKSNIIENPDFEVLEDIFWKKLPKLKSSTLMDMVNPVGGEEKKQAVLDIISKYGFKPSDLFYIGDSITDVQPLKFARENNGISVSFNGNDYAIKASEIAVLSENTTITSILADIFNNCGTSTVIEFVELYSENPDEALQSKYVNGDLKNILTRSKLPTVEIVKPNHIEQLIKSSSIIRRKLRGESIGGLG